MTTVLDAHLHIVSPDRVRYPVDPAGLPGGDWFERHPVSARDLAAAFDRAGVAGGLLVQAKGVYRFDNAYVADAAAAEPRRFAAVAIVDMTAADRLERLSYWTRSRGVGGIRLFDIPPADPCWLETPALDDVVHWCAEHGVRVSVATQPAHLDGLGRLLDAHPAVAVVVDHCGFVDVHGRPPYRGTPALRTLGEHPNLRVKVTSHILADPDDPRELVEHLAGLLGPDRLLWGSDYAQTHGRSYEELVALGRHACSGLSPAEQAAFLGGNLAALWPELAR